MNTIYRQCIHVCYSCSTFMMVPNVLFVCVNLPIFRNCGQRRKYFYFNGAPCLPPTGRVSLVLSNSSDHPLAQLFSSPVPSGIFFLPGSGPPAEIRTLNQHYPCPNSEIIVMWIHFFPKEQ